MRRLSTALFALALGLFGVTGICSAQNEPADRVTFGNNVMVAAGERVQNVVTMGGNAVIDGEVLGDVFTMGGNVTVNGHVAGDLVTLGGNASLQGDASVGGEITTMGGNLEASPGVHADLSAPAQAPPLSTTDGLADFVLTMLAGAADFLLLFLLGLLLLGVAPERFDALRVVSAREPVHATLLGAAGFVATVVAIIVLAITLIGIPAAILLAMGLSLACYVGLAAVGAVIGALLPVARLKDRPLLQLAAGVGTLYLCSLVPGVGTLILCLASALGLGALVRTRFGKDVPPSLPTPAGPYRDSAYPQGA